MTEEQAQTYLGAGWSFQPDVNYKYHTLSQEMTSRGDVFAQGLHQSLATAFCCVRRNAFASLNLGDTAALFLFNTGDACVVELHEADGAVEDILKQIENAREASADLVSRASLSLNRLAVRSGSEFRLRETITHTILCDDHRSPVIDQVAARCFHAEGLEFAPQGTEQDVCFIPGWSFSVCISEIRGKFWDCVGVMTRAQSEWYSVRVARDFCLRTLGKIDLAEPIGGLLDLERLVVGYQTEFRLWRHRMQEYRANLKPELTRQAAQIEDKWHTHEAKDYVNDTLAQGRNLIQSSYSRRLLIQERRQSLMIFLLTALGLLSVSSVAATYWNWLTLAGLYHDSALQTPQGNGVVLMMLIGLFVLTVALLVWYYFNRIRKD
ncbi:MAG: hypothetical protein N4A61_02385 [Pelagimonas sp.]|nr:hypothetical protein [Pelagimonas sp.]